MATPQMGSPRRRTSSSGGARARRGRGPEALAASGERPPTTAGVRHSKPHRTAPAAAAYGVPVPEGLHEAIELERGNLAKAESLLGCMVTSMQYESDSVTAPYYPDVAEIARDLVRRSINGLDSLTLQQRLSRNRVKEEINMLILGIASWGNAEGSLMAQQEKTVGIDGLDPAMDHGKTCTIQHRTEIVGIKLPHHFRLD